MSLQLLATAPFLGAYVLLAGCYGLLYCFYRLRHASALGLAAAASYALHLAVACGIIVLAPLGVPWKILLGASSLVILIIPPLTWRFLEYTHGTEGDTT